MKNRSVKYLITILCISLLQNSCKKFIEIEPPRNALVPANVYNSNDLATSAVLGLYEKMSWGFSPFSEGGRSVSAICGLAADEFIAYGGDPSHIYGYEILAENAFISSMWGEIYARIYNANAILEGLEAGNGVSPPVKSQLKGEALFVRAFSYFYLINLFGPVPLNLDTDYVKNGKSSKTPVEKIYSQIIHDLETSTQLLNENYITEERVRPNKVTAEALLARVYLYMEDWVNAEKYSTLVLERTNSYSLIGLGQVFLKNSKEAIWQLMPAANSNTPAGNYLILTGTPISTQISLTPDFALNAFETNDQRNSSWIKSALIVGVNYYSPYKYKVQSSTNVTEYTMVFRLAEQFLIRSEARAQQNKLTKAIEDLDAIRFRAGLPLVKNTNPAIEKDDLLKAIQKERKVELFSEWGHRWFDLKRTGQSTAVLSSVKPTWKQEYLLFPIPKTETDRNPTLK